MASSSAFLDSFGWETDSTTLHELSCLTYDLYILQACVYQDRFVSTMTKQREKMNKTVRTKKRGWYTKEKMKVKLGWSK